MRRMAVGLLGFTLVLVASATPLAAQKADIKARGYFGLGGGLSIPVGDYADVTKTGWVGDVFGGFTTKGGLVGGRLDAMWAQNSNKSGDGHTRLLGANADVVITPGRRPMKVHPYFLAGLGVYNGKSTQTGASGSSTKFAINGGAGVQVHTGHRMDVFLEGRFVTIRTSGTATNFVPIFLGLRWGGI